MRHKSLLTLLMVFFLVPGCLMAQTLLDPPDSNKYTVKATGVNSSNGGPIPRAFQVKLFEGEDILLVSRTNKEDIAMVVVGPDPSFLLYSDDRSLTNKGPKLLFVAPNDGIYIIVVSPQDGGKWGYPGVAPPITFELSITIIPPTGPLGKIIEDPESPLQNPGNANLDDVSVSETSSRIKSFSRILEK